MGRLRHEPSDEKTPTMIPEGPPSTSATRYTACASNTDGLVVCASHPPIASALRKDGTFVRARTDSTRRTTLATGSVYDWYFAGPEQKSYTQDVQAPMAIRVRILAHVP